MDQIEIQGYHNVQNPVDLSHLCKNIDVFYNKPRIS